MRNLKEQCARNGLKYTEQRQIILDLFRENNDKHLNGDEVINLLREEGYHVGQSTVYRSLSLLEQLHFLRGYEFARGVRYYELINEDEEEHPHVVCTECQKVSNIKTYNKKLMDQVVKAELGFTVTRHSFKFFGICKECAAKNPSLIENYKESCNKDE